MLENQLQLLKKINESYRLIKENMLVIDECIIKVNEYQVKIDTAVLSIRKHMVEIEDDYNRITIEAMKDDGKTSI